MFVFWVRSWESWLNVCVLCQVFGVVAKYLCSVSGLGSRS